MLSCADGTVLKCVNLGWGVFNVAEEVRNLSGIENVKVGNDANVAALGEMWKGGVSKAGTILTDLVKKYYEQNVMCASSWSVYL